MTDSVTDGRLACAAKASNDDESDGMSYLESLPRPSRDALSCRVRFIVVVLLFPF